LRQIVTPPACDKRRLAGVTAVAVERRVVAIAHTATTSALGYDGAFNALGSHVADRGDRVAVPAAAYRRAS
jgi:hypothetical protein